MLFTRLVRCAASQRTSRKGHPDVPAPPRLATASRPPPDSEHQLRSCTTPVGVITLDPSGFNPTGLTTSELLRFHPSPQIQKPCFPLVMYRQNQCDILTPLKAVKRQVPTPAA